MTSILMDAHTGLSVEINGTMHYVAVRDSITGEFYTPADCPLTAEGAEKALRFANTYDEVYGDWHPVGKLLSTSVFPYHWSKLVK